MNTEKNIEPINGYFAIIAIAVIVVLGIVSLSSPNAPIYELLLVPLLLLMVKGLVIVRPNSAQVLVLFGEYKGTISTNGFFWINPFYERTKISLKARNFESEKIKVNDKMGN